MARAAVNRRASPPRRPDAYARRMASNLRRHGPAVAALRDTGLDDAAIADLGLGLRDAYVRTDGQLVNSVLSYPLGATGGRTRFGCVNLAGVTGNPEHEFAWSAGEPATVRRGTGSSALVVAAHPMAAWRLGLAALRLQADVTVVASSQPDRMPGEWTAGVFWGRWPRILVLADVPAVVRDGIATAARRPLELAGVLAPPPRGVGTRDRDDEWLADLLEGGGRVQGVPTIAEHPRDDVVGDFAAEPVALHGGIAGGHLLYPFRIERRARAGAGNSHVLHSYETLVLRGDGAILSAELLPAPPGTPAHRRVHALSDGTRILAEPEASLTQSWSLDAIRAYAEDRLAGRDPLHRPPAEVVADVEALVHSRVTLPRREDASLVAGFVAMSHMFRAFVALPLLLIQGARGSGKSELGNLLAELGFNAAVMGRGSGPALVRLATECGGLIVLDDVEELSGPGGFGDLGQCLKLGYKAATSRKPVTSASGRIQTFDFFGPRVLTSTRGVEPILASRCLTIATSPDASPRPPVDIATDALRDELHALAMSRVAEVAAAYSPRIAAASTRAEEIRAPLLAIAEAFACPGIRLAIESGSR